jgi:hypothetical protein
MISVVVGTTSGVAFAGSDALTLQGAAAMWRAMGYVVGVRNGAEIIVPWHAVVAIQSNQENQ